MRVYLRVGVLKRAVRGHVLDDVSQNGVDLAFLSGENGGNLYETLSGGRRPF